jgi:pyrroloquinoline quinone (PQQ) biosynthesis protein C
MSTRFASLFYGLDRLKERAAPLVDRATALGSSMPWRRAALREEQAKALGRAPSCPDSREFLARLRAQVLAHPAVNHPLLGRLAHVPFVREDYRVFALQHYALVGSFTTYLELLLLSAPDSDAKQWIAKVLVDEYGEGSDGKDHAELYREFLRSTGVSAGEDLDAPLHAAVTGFIAEHLRICREEPFLVGLGAVGPGHEWSIPRMFEQVIRGLRRAGFAEPEILYFTLHVEQDQDHGSWLEEALSLYAGSREAQEQIHRGTMLSLAARVRFWSGVQDKIVRWRQPRNVHLRSQARRGGHNQADEMTLREWRSRMKTATRATGRYGRGAP